MVWEQFVEVVDTGTNPIADRNRINQVIRHWGSQGFELVSTSVVESSGLGMRRVLLFFKRPGRNPSGGIAPPPPH